MNGTRWTEPGQGATVGGIHDALCGKDRWEYTMSQSQRDALAHVCKLLWNDGHHYRATNLALTGEPLTAEDVERIGRAR